MATLTTAPGLFYKMTSPVITPPKILVYGIDRLSLPFPKDAIFESHYSLHFVKYKSTENFGQYDGVIFCQGIFEIFRDEYSPLGSVTVGEYDDIELKRRLNEVGILLRKGGFVCSINHVPFKESDDHSKMEDTDLSKILLNGFLISRKNIYPRQSLLNIKRDEFRNFLERHGAACSYYFKKTNSETEVKTIASSGEHSVSIILNNAAFIIPALLPKREENEVTAYFTSITKSIINCLTQIRQEIPEWTSSYTFPKEKILISQKKEAEAKLSTLQNELDIYKKFKKVLCHSGEPLVKAVSYLLNKGFGLRIDGLDEFREDLKILDTENNPVALVEVKGTNKGVKREHINQADSHRERGGFPNSFPSILIVNTNIKNTKTVNDKYQKIAEEQISHAANMNILILRTIDLLNIYQLLEKNIFDKQTVLKLLTSGKGWLKVTSDDYTLKS